MATSTEKWYGPVERFRDKLGTLGAGIKVAVWDNGMLGFKREKDAQEATILIGNDRGLFTKPLRGKSYVDGAQEELFDAPLGQFHGSEIARIIGATKENGGIAPESEVVIVKAAVVGKQYEVKKFVEDPLYGKLDLVNISYAFDHVLPSTPLIQQVITEMQQFFDGKKLIIAGVGNFTPFTENPKLTSPACLPNVVGVNATRGGWTNDLHRLSTKSDWVDVCAPGDGLKNYFAPTPQEGTSYASAIVTGICCLVMAYRKSRSLDHSPEEMNSMLRKACRPGFNKMTYGAGPLDLDILFGLVDLKTTRP